MKIISLIPFELMAVQNKRNLTHCLRVIGQYEGERLLLFQLSEKQYEWTAVSARANLKRWPDIEKILTSKVRRDSLRVESRLRNALL